MNALEIKNLSFSYRAGHRLLENIYMSAEDGEILCLLGPNGSGKTTLISQILFPDKSNASKIALFGKKMSELTLKERARLVGYVPQKIPPLHISVFQTVLMGRYPYSKTVSLRPTDDDIEITDSAIEKMGLTHLRDRQLNILSGGEIQRVFIAQSIAKKARIYFFDEPMSALDPEYQASFLSLLDAISREGATVVFSTHNPGHLFSLQNARAAILDKEHRLTELNINNENDLRKIESVYENSMKIKFSEEHRQFVSIFTF